MGLLYHTLTDIQSRSSTHLPPERHRLIFFLIADAISDGWPTNKTLDAGRSHPKETAPAAFSDCGCEVAIPNLRHFPSHHQFNQYCLIGSSNHQDLEQHVPNGTDLLTVLTPFLDDRQFADVNRCNNN